MSARMIVAPTHTIAPEGALTPVVLFVDLAEGVVGFTCAPVLRDLGRVRLAVLPETQGRPTGEALTRLAEEIAVLAEPMLDDWTIDEEVRQEPINRRVQGPDEDPDLVHLGKTAEEAWTRILARLRNPGWSRADLVHVIRLDDAALAMVLDLNLKRRKSYDSDPTLLHLRNHAWETHPGYGDYLLSPELEKYVQQVKEARERAYLAREKDEDKLEDITPGLARRVLDLLAPYTDRVGVGEGAHQRTVRALKGLGEPIEVLNRGDDDSATLRIGSSVAGDAYLKRAATGRWHLRASYLIEALRDKERQLHRQAADFHASTADYHSMMEEYYADHVHEDGSGGVDFA